MTVNLWGSAVTFRRCLAEKASFVLLNQFDLALTLLAMYLGYTELNPFMRNLLDMPLGLATVKVAIPLLIAWALPGKLLLPAIAALALVVGWDVKEILLGLL